MKFWRARTLHYWLALVSSVFILSTAVTGLLWAYAPYLYWQPGYKAKKRPLPEAAITSEHLPLESVANALSDPERPLRSVVLSSEGGRLLYRFSYGAGAPVLVDAVSGETLSPLPRDFAERIAAQYVPDGAARVTSAELVHGWEDRKHKPYAAVWIVRFGDDALTEIVLDAHTGEIAEDSDRIRRFHFGVMELHQFNFFGTHKVLTAVSGVPLILLLITGTVLAAKRLRGKRSAGAVPKRSRDRERGAA